MKLVLACAIAIVGVQMSNVAWAKCWVGNMPGNGMFCCDDSGCRVVHPK